MSKATRSSSPWDALRSGTYELLEGISRGELEPFLPRLVRAYVDHSDGIDLAPIIQLFPEANVLISYFEMDHDSLSGEMWNKIESGERIEQMSVESVETLWQSDCSRLRVVLIELLHLIYTPGAHSSSSAIFSETSDRYTADIMHILPVLVSRYRKLLPLEPLIKALILCPGRAQELVKSIVSNDSTKLAVVASIVAKLTGSRDGEDAVCSVHVADATLSSICELSPYAALSVRTVLVEAEMLPQTVLRVTLAYLQDEVALLGAHIDQPSSWLWGYVCHTRDTELILALERRLIDRLVDSDAESRSHNVLRLLSGLLLLGKHLLGSETIKAVVEFLRSVTYRSRCGPEEEKILQMGWCLLALYGHTASFDPAADLTWLLRDMISFGEGGESSNLMLLSAIHFHTNDLVANRELIGATLGMPSSGIDQTRLDVFGKFITAEVFSDEYVASQVAKLQTTPNLSAHNLNRAMDCVYSCLRGKLFRTYSMDISQWIVSQLLNCTEPVHPLMCPLLDEYAQSCMPGPSGILMRKMSVVDIQKAMKMPSMAVRVLALYFVLKFNSTVESSKHGADVGLSMVYSDTLINGMPVRELFEHVNLYSDMYVWALPCLMSQIVTSVPTLFTATSALTSEEFADADKWSTWLGESLLNLSDDLSPSYAAEIFENLPGRYPEVCCLLQQLDYMPTNDLLAYSDACMKLITVIAKADDEYISDQLMSSFHSVWKRLFVHSPSHVGANTFKALQPLVAGARTTVSMIQVSIDTLSNDPQVIVGLPATIFRRPVFGKMLLAMLENFLVMCEKKTKSKGEMAKKNQEAASLLLVQRAAIVHQLLNICLELFRSHAEAVDNDGPCLPIFLYIHQTFIEHRDVINLVHLQGYPIELVPAMVRNVPSMHVCGEFIPDIIKQFEIERRIFGVVLLSHIVKRYPVIQSQLLVKNTIEKMKRRNIDDHEAERFYTATLPCVVFFCEAFPGLIEDVLNLLYDVCEKPGTEKSPLAHQVRNTFDELVRSVALERPFISPSLLQTDRH